MSKFAILRTDKLKHLASVRRSLKHSFREQPTPNADTARAHENTHIGAANVEEAMRLIADKLPEKRRRDAVLAIEFLITGSPEAIHGKSRAEQDAYFDDALAWLRERHGADNVVYAGIHRDERTPHMYAYVIPLDPDTGRLNCRRYLGGAKALNQMQTEFAATVGQPHGLERGIEGSKAKHQRIKDWYAQVSSPGQHVTIPAEAVAPRVTKKGLVRDKREDFVQVAERLTKSARKAYVPAVEAAKVAGSERRRASEMARTAEAKDKALKTALEAETAAAEGKAKAESKLRVYEEIFEGLDGDEQLAVMRTAHKLRAEKRKREEAEAERAMTPEARERKAAEDERFRRELERVEREDSEGPEPDADRGYESPRP